MHLFSDHSETINLELPNAQVSYYPNLFRPYMTENIFNKLIKEIAWQQDTIKVFGKDFLQPRLTALYASNTKPYSYSNITMHPQVFTPTLANIKQTIEQVAGTSFTTCLCNLYRNGKDSNGWHADDEKELGNNPIIASVSFGATRTFKFRSKANHKLQHKLELTSGSLLLMAGATQHYWQHQIPKTTKTIAPRINLTFRIIQ